MKLPTSKLGTVSLAEWDTSHSGSNVGDPARSSGMVTWLGTTSEQSPGPWTNSRGARNAEEYYIIVRF